MVCCEACGSQKIANILDNLLHHYELNGVAMSWQYRLLECRECGLAFVDPKPTREVLGTFYNTTYHGYTSEAKKSYLLRAARCVKYWVAKQRYSFVGSKGFQAIARTATGIVAEWIAGKTVSFSWGIPLQLPKDARIFDLGYGSGYWLETMLSLGYNNLFGYDIDSNAENRTRLLSAGINVSGGVFIENGYPKSTFDCIRLEHVFEHLSQPVEVLAKCCEMLKPGGIIVMTFPCINSWSRSLSLIHYAHLDIPGHLYHHTQRSATEMVKKAGFEILKVKVFTDIKVLQSTINNVLINQRKRGFPSFFFIPFSPLLRLFGILTRKGDLVTIWAKRT